MSVLVATHLTGASHFNTPSNSHLPREGNERKGRPLGKSQLPRAVPRREVVEENDSTIEEGVERPSRVVAVDREVEGQMTMPSTRARTLCSKMLVVLALLFS